MTRINNNESGYTLNRNIQIENSGYSSKNTSKVINDLSSFAGEGNGGISEKVTEINNLVTELSRATLDSENEIKENISSLESGIGLIDAALSMELLMQSYPQLSLQVTSYLTDFFSAVLPAKLTDIPWIEDTLSLTSDISTLGKIFLFSLANGSRWTALICKHKMLNCSRKLLKNLQTEFESKQALTDPLQQKMTPEMKEKTQTLLKEWNEALKIQKKNLRQEEKELLLSSTINVLYIGFEVLNWLPLSKLSKVAEEVLLVGIDLGSQTLSLFVREIDLIRTLLKSNLFKGHRKSYKKWQKKTMPVAEINRDIGLRAKMIYEFESELLQMIEQKSSLEEIKSKIDTYLIIHPDYQFALDKIEDLAQGTLECLDKVIANTKNLLHKRQAVAQKKILLMLAEFDQIKPKLESRHLFLYEQSLLKIHELLRDPLASSDTIEKELTEFVFFNGSEEHASLLEAFQEYRKAVSFNSENELAIAQANLAEEFYAWMISKRVEPQFQLWFSAQPPIRLVRNYIAYQETIQQSTKNVLKQLVEDKQVLENKFLNFHLFSKSALFGMTLFCLAASIALVIVGLLTMPVGGLGVLVLITAIGPSMLGLGMIVLGLLYNLYYKPKETKALTLPLKTSLARMHRAFHAYRHTAKKKKLWKTAAVLHQLNTIKNNKNNSDYKKALNNFKEAERELKESSQKLELLTSRLVKLERKLANKAWIDFITHSSLAFSNNSKVFDSLRAISTALANCDLDPNYLDPDLQYLLKECGIDLAKLQVEMKQDPQAISSAIKSYIQLDLEGIINLIKKNRKI